MDETTITALREKYYTWEQIADHLNVSARVLFDWRKVNLTDFIGNHGIDIDGSEVARLRNLKYKWTDVAKEMKISRNKLAKWRVKTGYTDSFSNDDEISQELLHRKIAEEAKLP